MNIFWDHTSQSARRLLGLMDKNPLSPTFGCFHREYWHQRLCDFPSSSRQQGVLCLAFLWSIEREDNPYFHSQEILHYIEGALRYSLTLQKGDGTFDEWYPNERGWAGPTGYVTYALARTYELVEPKLDSKLKEELKAALIKSATFLANEWEEHVLFNHIAMALLPVYQVGHLFSVPTLKSKYQVLWKRFLRYWHEDEGWGVEYDGADIGYQSATASFLGRLHRYHGGDEIKELCEKSLKFVSYFCYPDGTFSRRIGCRQTETLFHYALVYWGAQGSALVKALSDWNSSSLKKGAQLLPADHDDHYFIYRFVEFLECSYEVEKRGDIAQEKGEALPFERDNFQKFFSKAGILCAKNDHTYSVVNFKRGAHVISFDTDKRCLRCVDSGIMARDGEGRNFTTLEFDDQYQIEVGEEEISVSGTLHEWSQQSFTPLKWIVFRIVMLIFGGHHKSAYWFKVLIRRILLRGQSRTSFHFKRVFNTRDHHLRTEVSDPTQFQTYLQGGVFDIRYVPQSRYFLETDLGHFPRAKGSL